MNTDTTGRTPSPVREQRSQQHKTFELLMPALQRAVAKAKYASATSIQEQSIPHLLEGRDLLGNAQTGTGKTAAFVLPLLQRLAANGRRSRKGTPRALIVAPTRELAAQIGESIEIYGQYTKLSHTVIFGGVKQHHQVNALARGIDVLVATPGRLLDLMQQGIIHLNAVEVFVLDEADRMLDMGFIPDIKRIVAKLPARRQTLFFSATMGPKMVALAKSMVSNPVHVTIDPGQPAVERITQKVHFVGKQNKNALLVELLKGPGINRAIVFTQMKHAANRVVKSLSEAGIRGAAIHGNKSQSARTKALNGFKQGHFRVLVATDVAARGIDVQEVSHVINYDLPTEAETYVHRIGRTARAGADGKAISFCCAEDRAYLRSIEALLGKPVPAELQHPLHCETARHSTEPAPKRQGRNRGATPRANRRPPQKARGRRQAARGRRR